MMIITIKHDDTIFSLGCEIGVLIKVTELVEYSTVLGRGDSRDVVVDVDWPAGGLGRAG